MPICMLGPHRALMDLPCCLPLSSPPMRGALLHEYVAYDTARKHVVLRRRGPAPGDGQHQRENAKPRQKPPGQGSTMASGRQDGTAGWAGKCPGSNASIRNGTRLHQLAHDAQSPGQKGSRDLFPLGLLMFCLPFRPVKIPRRSTRLI
ncbi:hypothetical protein B0H65DRAFT_432738 [Neurospora tetraspora]|uniref:Uncharacterized protein n=1 Tax=Neurospora tetraspora TaxID=94610 RepID=A0AAE0J9M5_9PEZI|nr:hypothetical protein B0H65DRAFT_432738 [Neurospora tetraspora]